MSYVNLLRQVRAQSEADRDAPDPWIGEIAAWLAEIEGDRGLIHSAQVCGLAHRFVLHRDVQVMLNASGAVAARRIRSAMRALGWKPRTAYAFGRRRRGFVRPSEVQPLDVPRCDVSSQSEGLAIEPLEPHD